MTYGNATNRIGTLPNWPAFSVRDRRRSTRPLKKAKSRSSEIGRFKLITDAEVERLIGARAA